MSRFRWLQMSFEVMFDQGPLSEEEAIAAITSLPKDLGLLYQRVYEQIERGSEKTTKIVRRFLTLLLHTEVPLKSGEFIEAILHGKEIKRPEAYLIDLCKGLVEWHDDQDTFRLAHTTVRPFLEDKIGYDFFSSHALLADMCLGCITQQLPDSKAVKKWKARTFLSYAFAYWPWHVLYAWTKRFEDPSLSRYFPSTPDTDIARWTTRVAAIIDSHVADVLERVGTKSGMGTPILSNAGTRPSSAVAIAEVDEHDSVSIASPVEADAGSNSPRRNPWNDSDPPDRSGEIFDPDALELLNDYANLSPSPLCGSSARDAAVIRHIRTWKEFRSQLPNPVWSIFYWEIAPTYLTATTKIDPILMTTSRDRIWYSEIGRDGDEQDVSAFRKEGPPVLIFSHEANYENIVSLFDHVEQSQIDRCILTRPLTGVLDNQRLTPVQIEELLQSLFEKGCSPNELYGLDGNYSFFHRVAAKCSTSTVLLLLDHGANVDARSKHEMTPVGAACVARRPEIVQLLVDHGASVVSTWGNGKTMAHALAFFNNGLNPVRLSKALQQGDSSDDSYDEYSEILSQLVDSGANLSTPEMFGRTALHSAVLRNELSLVDALLNRSISSRLVDQFGWTPLHCAVVFQGTGQSLRAESADSEEAMVAALLTNSYDSGEALDARDFLGSTALTLAVVTGKAHLAQALLEVGTSPNTLAHRDVSLLALACAAGEMSLASALFTSGARDDITNDVFRKCITRYPDQTCPNPASIPQDSILNSIDLDQEWPRAGETHIPGTYLQRYGHSVARQYGELEIDVVSRLHNIKRCLLTKQAAGALIIPKALDLREILLDTDMAAPYDNSEANPFSCYLARLAQCKVLILEETVESKPDSAQPCSLPIAGKSRELPPWGQAFIDDRRTHDVLDTLSDIKSSVHLRLLDTDRASKFFASKRGGRLLDLLRTHGIPDIPSTAHLPWMRPKFQDPPTRVKKAFDDIERDHALRMGVPPEIIARHWRPTEWNAESPSASDSDSITSEDQKDEVVLEAGGSCGGSGQENPRPDSNKVNTERGNSGNDGSEQTAEDEKASDKESDEGDGSEVDFEKWLRRPEKPPMKAMIEHLLCMD